MPEYNAAQQKQIQQSMQHIAERAAEAAVLKVFAQLGIDTSTPIKTQEQFAALRRLSALADDKDFNEDIAWLRRLRVASDVAKDVGWRTVVKIVVTALIGIIAIGTKDYWLSHFVGNGKP